MQTRSLGVILILASASIARAAIGPSFSLEDAAWPATDVIVAAQGKNPGDPLRVPEVWKGDLKPDTLVRVADMPVAPILVSTQFGAKPPIKTVSGERMVLLLAKADDATKTGVGGFRGAAPRGAALVSTVWIEGTEAYAFQQEENPGPTEIHPLGQKEDAFKKQLLAVLDAHENLRKAQAIAAPLDRAKALEPMTASPFWYQRKDAFAALGSCGKEGLAILRPMLKNQRNNAPDLVNAIVSAAGNDAAIELTAILNDELPYWRKTGPTLKPGWWNADPAEKRAELQAQYQILTYSLRALAAVPHSPPPDVVAQLRELWTSLPQLKDQPGVNAIVEQCDPLLPAGPAKPADPPAQ